MTCNTTETPLPPASDTTPIRLGGAFRLPPVAPVKLPADDAGRIRLGGAFRLV